MAITLERHEAAGIARAQDSLGQLRGALRDFPCLYAGDAAFEARVLRPYLRSARSLAVTVARNRQSVGAVMALPLAEAPEAVLRPFVRQGYDPAGIWFLSGPLVLPPYRGRGLGSRLLRECEAQARRWGLRYSALFMPERPADHPRRPRRFTAPDGFWSRHGYHPHPQLRAELDWPEVGEAGETCRAPKPVTFWLKELKA